MLGYAGSLNASRSIVLNEIISKKVGSLINGLILKEGKNIIIIKKPLLLNNIAENPHELPRDSRLLFTDGYKSIVGPRIYRPLVIDIKQYKCVADRCGYLCGSHNSEFGVTVSTWCVVLYVLVNGRIYARFGSVAMVSINH